MREHIAVGCADLAGKPDCSLPDFVRSALLQ
jgi:hypothetical protein